MTDNPERPSGSVDEALRRLRDARKDLERKAREARNLAEGMALQAKAEAMKAEERRHDPDNRLAAEEVAEGLAYLLARRGPRSTRPDAPNTNREDS